MVQCKESVKGGHYQARWQRKLFTLCRVGDPVPEDPFVFGPPGSGYVSQRSGSDPSIIKQK
jgi:hypothetical protein